ncbi:hypothetical protein JR064_00250 [Xanthomonas sp. CFBP 8703]|uniref:Uncharacterized protein n=1 Tax=Xanthomonas bonasiae TaxID=2810351 RepID=A0ABS3AWH2_9XANT|nr:hypothetical protein [Xanthomonas bonasiae]MBN6100596.1 hypothetical protein [Xanthomonas bonasiae]
METKMASDIFDVTIIDEDGNQTTRTISQRPARFTVKIKPASASEKRLAVATRAIRKAVLGGASQELSAGILRLKRAKPSI